MEAFTTYVARQPIFNARSMTIGHELLFRDGENNAFPTHVAPDRSTYRLIAENYLSVGQEDDSKSRCFINFPHQSLVRRLPLSLPKDTIVVEVLETCTPNDELLEAVRELRQNGYLIALDDFAFSEEWERFLPFVHIVKLDVMAMGIDKACEFVVKQQKQGSSRRYLAEKVETDQDFQAAKQAGFSFFQGFFFSKPIIKKQVYVSSEQVVAMELFHQVCLPEVDFDRIEQIVSKDVTLSYKLLKFVNNMGNRLETEISSFRQALVYLGQEQLKLFVSLAVASFVSRGKPKALYELSLQRAHFCRLMSRHEGLRSHREQAFMIGLFSILDAIMDIPIAQLMKKIPLAEDIKMALLRREGPYGQLLLLGECFELADWQGMEKLRVQLGVTQDDVFAALADAQNWTQKMQAASV
ncbi:EAL and HDOD domain-containing protein [Vibrio hippocampi]|uniref:Cyclic di-GMP phosphodiesterase CdgJ n=1 Tax=Vibrio hippocampi TaxID=654686 RepID=A0ABN8DKK2_9VIBR|nr:HDOD domain-containing protein [Vibrio hippocampi]CAH0527367.1 Cyclic di-GMP phosphodiesterase CdgJ [Vibrio hippocampi]